MNALPPAFTDDESTPLSGPIRRACLVPAQAGWEVPTAAEVRAVLKLAGLTGSAAAQFLGLGASGSRTVRKWAGGEAEIPYAAWALLCAHDNLGLIWRFDGPADFSR